MNLRTSAAFVVAAGSLFTFAASGAAVITGAGSALDQNTVPAPGTSGYIFYQVEATPPANGGGTNAGVNLGTAPSYASVSTAGDQFFASGSGFPYTTLTVAGTAYKTGIAYQFPGNGSPATLATITLGAGTPTNFRLGVLTNNTDNLQNVASAVTVASGGSTVTQQTNLRNGHNDFYYFNVAGAAGDQITVALTQSGGAAAPLGGLTFDPVPEPASMGVMGLGAVAMLGRRGRRR